MTEDAQTHLTEEAHRRLVEELERRKTTERTQISAWIERAREHGDIRENADYDAAKNEQGLNEARIRQLEKILENAQIVEAAEGDVVASGTVVTISIGGDTSEYLVGSIEERHDTYDVLSTGSPLGKALLGHRAGETVEYEAPVGTLKVEILEIRPLT
ncbi:MAG TPA: transcription elongation factor GreA [Acidimicrobiia bacterium]|nr:transcription elongation factor GreA [Acidimicrobiia bacterium]